MFLSVISRIFTVLTIVLGVATMAVSAYAARQEQAQAASGDPPAEANAAPETAQVDPTEAAHLEVWATVAAQEPSAGDPTPTPTVTVRYAAPVGAASVDSLGAVGRSDLSPGPDIHPELIASVKPRPVNLQNLATGGLDVPLDQLVVMQQVSQMTGIPWQILAGIAKVESNFGQNMATSSAGAIGYGQFLPAMWKVFGNGGDPYDFRDAIPAMGRYLVAAGAPADIPGALYAYNHSWSYVDLVLSYAEAYGYQRAGGSRGLIWPVIGPISTYFSPGHPAIDIDQTASPRAPVRAAHDGVVYFAGGDPCCGYGQYVILSSPSGLATLYAHLSAFSVRPGDTVRQGDQLGVVGCTGRCTGPHVHFEVIEDNQRRNPLQYLP